MINLEIRTIEQKRRLTLAMNHAKHCPECETGSIIGDFVQVTSPCDDGMNRLLFVREACQPGFTTLANWIICPSEWMRTRGLL